MGSGYALCGSSMGVRSRRIWRACAWVPGPHATFIEWNALPESSGVLELNCRINVVTYCVCCQTPSHALSSMFSRHDNRRLNSDDNRRFVAVLGPFRKPEMHLCCAWRPDVSFVPSFSRVTVTIEGIEKFRLESISRHSSEKRASRVQGNASRPYKRKKPADADFLPLRLSPLSHSECGVVFRLSVSCYASDSHA